MPASLAPSIFNDVIGPIMRGPSSSHSAASVRIGLLLRDLCGGHPDSLVIDYDNQGSLATTHTSQGTDMGLYGGLLGFTPDDERLPHSPSLIADAGTSIEIRKPRLDDAHPNTYRIAATRNGNAHSIVALSTGGGMIEVVELDGWKVSMFGDYAVRLLVVDGSASTVAASIEAAAVSVDDIVVHRRDDDLELVIVSAQKPLDESVTEALDSVRDVHRLRAVLPVLSRRDLVIPFNHASELPDPEQLDHRPLSDWALRYESVRGGIDESEVLAKARHLLGIIMLFQSFY